MADISVVAVDSENFNEQVLSAEVPVLVDFWATWCGPCRKVAPVLDELAGEMHGKVRIAKLDVDQSQDVAIQYQVQGIPTLILFKNGEVADRMQGARPKPQIQEFISRHL